MNRSLAMTVLVLSLLRFGFAQPADPAVDLTIDSYPPCEVYLQESAGLKLLGRSGNPLRIQPPALRDGAGRFAQYGAGQLVLRAPQHEDGHLSVTPDDWKKGHLSYSLVPHSFLVSIQDFAAVYPGRTLVGLLFAITGLLAVGIRLREWQQIRQQCSQLEVAVGVDPMLGKKLGEYLVVARLGKGGMGTVYRVQDPLGVDYAAKVLFLNAYDPLSLQRFRREFKLASQLDHPSLLRSLSYSEENGLAYCVMEYLQGETLDRFIHPGGSPWSEVWPCIRSILEGLDCAHRQGVVHRDLKPANIMIVNSSVKILDFGLARQSDITALTVTGKALGTPTYLAPEQVTSTSKDVEPRTDQYALGCIIFELLTGRPPFIGEDVINQHLHEDPPPILSLRSDLPPDLEAVVQRMLAKDAVNRYPTTADVLAAMSKLQH